jgi:hypothetical protein
MHQVQIDDQAWARLEELRRGWAEAHPDDVRSREWLVADAIRRVHRGFIGLPHSDPNAPASTGRFEKWASDNAAEVLIRQVDATQFVLAQPFRLHTDEHLLEVHEDNVTDLASVPSWFTWLVPRYGRHTLAALLHDSLQPGKKAPWPDPPPHGITAEGADALFRDAMGDTGVPLVRRWVMWAAVALRTEVRFATRVRAVRAIAWAVLFGLVGLLLWPVLITGALGSGLAARVALLLIALVAPGGLGVVWGSRWRLGLIAGAALLFLVIPVLLVLVALGIFGLVEAAVEHTVVRKESQNPILNTNLAEVPY